MVVLHLPPIFDGFSKLLGTYIDSALKNNQKIPKNWENDFKNKLTPLALFKPDQKTPTSNFSVNRFRHQS